MSNILALVLILERVHGRWETAYVKQKKRLFLIREERDWKCSAILVPKLSQIFLVLYIKSLIYVISGTPHLIILARWLKVIWGLITRCIAFRIVYFSPCSYFLMKSDFYWSLEANLFDKDWLDSESDWDRKEGWKSKWEKQVVWLLTFGKQVMLKDCHLSLSLSTASHKTRTLLVGLWRSDEFFFFLLAHSIEASLD